PLSPPTIPSPLLHSPPPPLFFHYCSRAHRDLHSFPTRRSSDLRAPLHPARRDRPDHRAGHRGRPAQREAERLLQGQRRRHRILRSEEHTSELQSLTNLVCRLLLEKKKETKTSDTSHTSQQHNSN